MDFAQASWPHVVARRDCRPRVLPARPGVRRGFPAGRFAPTPLDL